jgi:hypothetical protein
MGSMHQNKNRFVMAMVAMLAAPTNHSLGDVVYKKVTTLKVSVEDEDASLVTMPNAREKTVDKETFRVLKIQATPAVGLTALLEGGHDKSMLPGTVLKAHRPYTNAQGLEEGIPVALLKVLEVRDTYSIAEIVTNGSLDSSLHFTDYPELMVGDRAIPEAIHIVSRTQLLPTVSLTYKNLFVDPKSNPSSYELTPDGTDRLLDKAKIFASVHAPLILIEAYTDAKGDRATNQMESQNRAATIRQTLIDRLSIDPERIVALGLGEAESGESIPLPGDEDEARRVIIKVKSLPNAK